MKINKLSDRELLEVYGESLEEMVRREIVANAYEPLTDLAVVLLSGYCGLMRVTEPAKRGHHALDLFGQRYRIAGRAWNRNALGSYLIGLDPVDNFDVLAVVQFDGATITAEYAHLIPVDLVQAKAKRWKATGLRTLFLSAVLEENRRVIRVGRELREFCGEVFPW